MFGKNETQPDLEYFVLHDSKVGNYREPMPAVNEADIIRQTEMTFRNPAHQQNQLYTNAEDFSLYRCGSWSKKTGIFSPCNLQHIANLQDIKSYVIRRVREQQTLPVLEKDGSVTPPRALTST